jgi:phosphatidylserine/phosphatidylglycerophosphate/cardiolipin synthase-like enzyme
VVVLPDRTRSLAHAAALFSERHLGPRLAPRLRQLRARSVDRNLAAASRFKAKQPVWSATEPRWSPYGTVPKAHNRLTPLIDGEAFLGRLHTAICDATRYVYIAGWCLTPHLPLLRGSAQDLIDSRLITVLSQAASRLPVRILLWGGAPLLLQPTKDYVEQVKRTLEKQASGDLVCQLDKTASMTHSHHQKAIVVDGQLAFVGGTDLTTSAGDRWDQRGHPLRAGVNWHDASVLIEGEAVADVEENFRQRWRAVTGDGSLPNAEPRVDKDWSTAAQVVRTIPRGAYQFARYGEFGIHYSYMELLRRAKHFIYLETQYLWSPEILACLVDLIQQPPSPQFRIIIVLPAHATSGKWDNDQHVEALRKVDAGRGVVEVYSLYTSGPTAGAKPFHYRPVYVHAKLGVIDDEWVMIGSANLNDRGLHSDGEIAMVAKDQGLARKLRVDLWSEHLAIQPQDLGSQDVTALIDGEWRQRSSKNARILAQGEEPLQSAIHRYESGKPPGAWILEESQALTFEH